MLRCYRAPEPEDFDKQVRQPGQRWLANHSSTNYEDYWSRCKQQLADVFQRRCGYTAMKIAPRTDGTIDHYLSKKNRPDLIYEWSNYRYSTRHVNSCKGTYDDRILDPFEVEDDWFEVQTPDLQLVLTDRVPPELREKAEFTLRQLQLQNSEWIMEQRADYYDAYWDGEMTLSRIEKEAPLVARAIVRRQSELESNRKNLGDS
jgi:hypothetical protein